MLGYLQGLKDYHDQFAHQEWNREAREAGKQPQVSELVPFSKYIKLQVGLQGHVYLTKILRLKTDADSLRHTHLHCFVIEWLIWGSGPNIIRIHPVQKGTHALFVCGLTETSQIL